MNTQNRLLFLSTYLIGLGLIFTNSTLLMFLGFTLTFVSLYKITRK